MRDDTPTDLSSDGAAGVSGSDSGEGGSVPSGGDPAPLDPRNRSTWPPVRVLTHEERILRALMPRPMRSLPSAGPLTDPGTGNVHEAAFTPRGSHAAVAEDRARYLDTMREQVEHGQQWRAVLEAEQAAALEDLRTMAAALPESDRRRVLRATEGKSPTVVRNVLFRELRHHFNRPRVDDLARGRNGMRPDPPRRLAGWRLTP